MLVEAYLERVRGMLAEVVEEEAGPLDHAAGLLADCITRGGVVHTFGSGHSSSVAREAAGRAGALVPVNTIVDHSEDAAERVPGYAAAVLAAYERQFGLYAGEVLVVASNSGVNPLPVELAELARERGLSAVALVNVRHCCATPSRLEDGRTLCDVADVVLDIHGAVGDTALTASDGTPVGPTSTVVGAFLMHALVLRTIERLQEAGADAPVLLSENLPDRPVDDLNAVLRARYRGRLRYPGG